MCELWWKGVALLRGPSLLKGRVNYTRVCRLLGYYLGVNLCWSLRKDVNGHFKDFGELFSVQININVLKVKFHAKKELHITYDSVLTIKKCI